jgi:hypothetical protein
MRMSNAFVGVLGTALLLSILVSSCQVQTDSRRGEPYIPYVTNQIVVDTSKVLDDGAGVSWKLEPGKYQLEMTANNDGATAEWVGGGCPKTQPSREVTMTCEMPRTGQLVITNPTVFALGKQVSVTVKLTKLAQ